MVKGLLRRLLGSPRLNLESQLASRSRISSYPYLSGDTFRDLSDVVVDETGISSEFWEIEQVIFCATKYIRQVIDLAQTSQNLHVVKSMTLLIHNGDQIPEVDLFGRLLELFHAVYSVNVTLELEALGVLGLPIGLENLHWDTNGKIEKYPALGEVKFSDSWNRPNLILSSFSVHTNQPVRSDLMELLQLSRLPRLEIHGDGTAYELGLRNSVFVLSPQGNGLDCHRTWEALYSGAIPVVTQGTLSKALSKELPILVTPDWATFLRSSEEELREAAKTLGSMSLESAYMPYWIDKLDLRK